jgi:uncharacterized membrane protein HdeD (DUF308 family)
MSLGTATPAVPASSNDFIPSKRDFPKTYSMNTPDPRPVRQFATKAAGSLWWYFLLRGLLLLGVGIFVLVRPGLSAVAFAQVLGFLFLVEGVLAVIAGIMGRTPSRGATIVRGILLALLGIFVFAHPAFVTSVAITTILYVVAAFVMVGGILEIIAAIRDKDEPEGEGASVLGGLLSVAFGFLLIFAPISFGLVIVRILGIAAILIGVVLVFLAFKFRKARNALKG